MDYSKLEEMYDKLEREYINYLKKAGKSDRVIKKNREAVFMVTHYILRFEGTTPDNITSSTISMAYSVLGIHKYFITSITHAKDVISGIKPFALFLMEAGYITDSTCKDILAFLKNNKEDMLEEAYDMLGDLFSDGWF